MASRKRRPTIFSTPTTTTGDEQIELWLLESKQQYEAGHIRYLLNSLDMLPMLSSSWRGPAATWFLETLSKCVREYLKHQPANRTRNHLAILEAEEQDELRFARVLKHAGEVRTKYGTIRSGQYDSGRVQGIPITRAYKLAARELSAETGVHVRPYAAGVVEHHMDVLLRDVVLGVDYAA